MTEQDAIDYMSGEAGAPYGYWADFEEELDSGRYAWRVKPKDPDGATVVSWGIVLDSDLAEPCDFLHETHPNETDGDIAVEFVELKGENHG